MNSCDRILTLHECLTLNIAAEYYKKLWLCWQCYLFFLIGFQRFKVNVANMLTLRNVITLATCLGLAPGVVDKLKRSETPTLDVISELESNGFISCSDISRLLDGLKRCNLSGIASKIEYSYQTNVKDHLSSQSRTFQGIFVSSWASITINNNFFVNEN